MTLATHIVAGAVAAKFISNHPVEAFVVGAVSHYLLDTIPHWDYKINSFVAPDENKPLEKKVRFDKGIFLDIGKVVLDVFIGFALIFVLNFFVSENPLNIWLLFAAAIGGAAPDFAQFLYGLWKVWPLKKIQDLHNWVHAKIKLDNRPEVGVPLQFILIVVLAVFLIK
jgi:hypothetical protein